MLHRPPELAAFTGKWIYLFPVTRLTGHQTHSGLRESAIQSRSNMKIAYATKAKEAAQARINSLHLPFPKALKTMLATSMHAAILPKNFQSPGDGIVIPCGLPPL